MRKTVFVLLALNSIVLFCRLKFVNTFYDNVKTIVIEQTTINQIESLFGKPDEITSENKYDIWEYKNKNRALLIKFNNENKVYAYSYKVNNAISPNILELKEIRNIQPYASTEQNIYQSFGQPSTVEMTSSSITIRYLNKETKTFLSVDLANEAPYVVKHFQYSSKNNEINQLNSSNIEKLRIEETTIDDMASLLGIPNEIQVYEKGEYWAYNYKSAILVLNFKSSENPKRTVLSQYKLHN